MEVRGPEGGRASAPAPRYVAGAPPSGGVGSRDGRGDSRARRWRELGAGPGAAGAPALGRPGAEERFVTAISTPPPMLKAPLLSLFVPCVCRCLGDSWKLHQQVKFEGSLIAACDLCTKRTDDLAHFRAATTTVVTQRQVLTCVCAIVLHFC